jgi:hypothetical protein
MVRGARITTVYKDWRSQNERLRDQALVSSRETCEKLNSSAVSVRLLLFPISAEGRKGIFIVVATLIMLPSMILDSCWRSLGYHIATVSFADRADCVDRSSILPGMRQIFHVLSVIA